MVRVLLYLFLFSGTVAAFPGFNYMPLPVMQTRFEQLETLQTNLRSPQRFKSPVVVRRYFDGQQTISTIDIPLGRNLFVVGGGIVDLLPNNLKHEVWLWEKRGLQVYKSMLQLILRMNPIPGMGYLIRIRDPANPFIHIPLVHWLSDSLGTESYSDDLKFKETLPSRYQYGFGFQIFLY